MLFGSRFKKKLVIFIIFMVVYLIFFTLESVFDKIAFHEFS